MAVFFVLTVFPLLLGLGYALLYSLGLVGVFADGFTFRHWRYLFEGGELWYSLLLSAWVAFASIVAATVFAFSLVLGFRERLEKGPLSRMIYLPLTLPAVGVAFFSFQLLSASGWLARLSYQVGWVDGPADFPDFVNDEWGMGIIFAHTFMASPFLTLLFLNIYRNEKIGAYINLAKSLGAGPFQIFIRTVLPLIWWKALPTLLLYFVFVLSSYEVPLLLGQQHPQMISVLAISKLQRFNLLDIPQAYAVSVFYAFLILIFLGFWLARLRRQGAIL